jgi:hypothetical protein
MSRKSPAESQIYISAKNPIMCTIRGSPVEYRRRSQSRAGMIPEQPLVPRSHMALRWLIPPTYVVHVDLMLHEKKKSAKDSQESTDTQKGKDQHPDDLFAHGQPKCRVLTERIRNGKNPAESHDLEYHAWNQVDGEQCSRHLTAIDL